MSYVTRSGRRRKTPYSYTQTQTSTSLSTSTGNTRKKATSQSKGRTYTSTQDAHQIEANVPVSDHATVTSLGYGFGPLPTIGNIQHTLASNTASSDNTLLTSVWPNTTNVPPITATASMSMPIIQQGHTIDTIAYTPTPVINITNDVASTVPQTIKDKVVKGEYIDLATLLTNSSSHDVQKLVVSNGEITIQNQKAKSKLLTLDQWTNAFIIFISIYCSIHASRFQELLKYMYVVRQGAARNTLGWLSYDEQYRLRKANNPESSWADVDMELWLLFMNGYQSYSNRVNTYQYPYGSNLKCYPFNYNKSCTRQTCIYSHTCIKCNGNHPVVACFYASKNSFTQNNQYQPRYTAVRTPRHNVNNFNSFRNQLRATRPRFTASSVGQGSYPY